MERRKVVRFLLRCPAVFEWIDEEGQLQVGAGFTRDISASGVFLLSASCPPEGAHMRIEVLLPTERPSEEGLKLSSEATVIHVEQGLEACGFGARSEFAFVGDMASSTASRACGA